MYLDEQRGGSKLKKYPIDTETTTIGNSSSSADDGTSSGRSSESEAHKPESEQTSAANYRQEQTLRHIVQELNCITSPIVAYAPPPQLLSESNHQLLSYIRSLENRVEHLEEKDDQRVGQSNEDDTIWQSDSNLASENEEGHHKAVDVPVLSSSKSIDDLKLKSWASLLGATNSKGEGGHI